MLENVGGAGERHSHKRNKMRRSSYFQLPEGFQKLGMEVPLHLFVLVRNMATSEFQ